MKIGNNIPKTLIDICKKDGRVLEITNEGRNGNTDTLNDYWLYLKDGWNWCDCSSVHETTVADCKEALQAVTEYNTE